MSGPFVLVPITITDAMVTSSTAAEPDASETAWNAVTAYTVGQEAILTAPHRVYKNLLGGAHATSPELALTGDTPRWLDARPTNKWAAFDGQVDTQSELVTPLTWVLRPGMFNAIALYGLDGSALDIEIKDAPGGTVVDTLTSDLLEPPIDHYDYYFGQIRSITKVLWRDLVPYADPEVTITITAAAGVTVKAGMIAFGDLRPLVTVEGTGGTGAGARVKPKTYSYINTDVWGVTRIVRRAKATDMEIRVKVPSDDADAALATLQEVLDVPACWIGSDDTNVAGLNVFGLASGDLSYEDEEFSILQINVKGFI